MRTRSLRHLTAVAALALTTIAVAACTAAPRGQPSTAEPISTARGTASPTATASTTAAPPTRVPHRVATPRTVAARAPVPPRPTVRPARCLGAVTYTIDTAKKAPPRTRLCIAVGGVVEVRNLGPGDLAVSPGHKVSCYYEAAVHPCRLIQTGSVTFTISRPNGNQVVTVSVAKASSPPRPAPACLGAKTVFTLDAVTSQADWPAICMKLGALVRFTQLGPDGLSVSPAGAVSCSYEAAVHPCRLVKPGTVTFTVAGPHPRTLTVVAVR